MKLHSPLLEPSASFLPSKQHSLIQAVSSQFLLEDAVENEAKGFTEVQTDTSMFPSSTKQVTGLLKEIRLVKQDLPKPVLAGLVPGCPVLSDGTPQ